MDEINDRLSLQIKRLTKYYQLYTHKENTAFFDNYIKNINSVNDLISVITNETLKEKRVLIIAGAIGSGKSTLLHNMLKINKIHDVVILSPDIYLHKFYPDLPYLDAYNKTKEEISDSYLKCIEMQCSFIVEMVPAKKDKLELLELLKQSGYCIICLYLFTEDVNTNIIRMENRVHDGAFPIPISKMKNRFTQSHNNISFLESISDYFYVFNCDSDKIELVEKTT